MAFVDTSDEVIKQMRNAARRGCRKIAKAVVDETVMTAPNRRGHVRTSLKLGARVSTTTGQASGTVGYLSKRKLKEKGIKFILNPAWLEFGTKPHMIYVRKIGKYGNQRKFTLANKSQAGGLGVMFGGKVAHPGSKPIPMLKEAGKRVAPRAEAIAAKELKILNETIEVLKNLPDDGNDEI